MVKVIIAGIGGYGRALIGLLLTNASRLGVEIVAAADTRLGSMTDKRDLKAEQGLKKAGVRLYTDALEMFRDCRGRADAAYVITGIPSHESLGVAAMWAGYHLHLEKPPAATIQEAESLLDASRRSGRMVLVGFQWVHSLDVRGLKQRLLSGRLGRIKHIACWAGWPRDREYFTRGAWSGRLRSGGRWVMDGPVSNALAHDINSLLFLCGPSMDVWADPLAVRAELYAAWPIEAHDTAAVEIQTAQGPRAYFLASHCIEEQEQYGPTYLVSAEHGSAVLGHKVGAQISYEDGTSESFHEQKDEPRLEMLENFIRAVAANDASMLRCPLEQARKMTLVANAAHESSLKIHRIGPEFTYTSSPDTLQQRIHVKGLDQLLQSAAAEGSLLSNLPDAPPWAVRTQAFGLDGYVRFPQRFEGPAEA